jgi:thiamine transporter ThiT
MKLTTGVKWGLVAGLVVGVLAGVLAYMSVMSILDALVEYAYQEMVKMGTPPAQAREAAEFTRQIAPPSAFAGGIISSVIIYLIMGLVMAAVWEMLKLPWYAKGALFGVVLTVLLSLPSLLLPPPPDIPTAPAVYGYASTALNFAGPILLAWLLNRAASRA